jgi:hypothetical protein
MLWVAWLLGCLFVGHCALLFISYYGVACGFLACGLVCWPLILVPAPPWLSYAGWSGFWFTGIIWYLVDLLNTGIDCAGIGAWLFWAELFDLLVSLLPLLALAFTSIGLLLNNPRTLVPTGTSDVGPLVAADWTSDLFADNPIPTLPTV